MIANASHLYWLRVRRQPFQELLALFGIAAGVALLFAVQVASSSVVGAVDHLVDGVTGSATIELAARDPYGMDQDVATQVAELENIAHSAPILQRSVTVLGPKGTASLTLIGADRAIESLDSDLLREFQRKFDDIDAVGFFITSDTAEAIGASPGDDLVVVAGTEERRIRLAGVAGRDMVGDLVESPVAVAPLGLAQRLTGMENRVSRVLVVPKSLSKAKSELNRVGHGFADERPVDSEVRFLAHAMKPDRTSSAMFSAIAVVIGLLFAYNAMLLTSAQRRRQTALVRMLGADRPTVIGAIIFDVLLLGLAACFLGLVLGDQISRLAFRTVPEYLASGFPIGTQRTVGAGTIALTIAGGLVAALLASARSAADLLRTQPTLLVGDERIELEAGEKRFGRAAMITGVLLFVGSLGAALRWPQVSVFAVVGLLISMVLIIGFLVPVAVSAMRSITRKRGSVSFSVAVSELASTPLRTTALALIAASASMAIISIGGAKLDLERGIDRLTGDYFGSSSLWLVPRDSSNVFVTKKFDARGLARKLGKQPEIATIGRAEWTFLDFEDRRVLIISPPSDSSNPLVQSQVKKGDSELAVSRLREGGWVAVSDGLEGDREVEVGDYVTLPAPSGDARLRVAAVTANHGWPSGSVVISEFDYQRLWGNDDVSALALGLAPGVSIDEGKRIVSAAIGNNRALSVKTAEEMVGERSSVFAQGLSKLRQISLLVLFASILALTAAMVAAVWQRRRRVSSLRAIGMYKGELRRSLVSETAFVVAFGSLGGMVFGLVGQYLASSATMELTGYMAPFNPAILFGFKTLTQVVLLSVVVTVIPAVFMTRLLGSGRFEQD